MVFSNKIILVSLLVLGLLLSQPTQGEARLQKRVAGGFQAQAGQFPFIVLINYQYTSGGTQFTYQGTGAIYDSSLIMTSNQVFTNIATCVTDSNNGLCPVTIVQGVTDVNNQASGTIAKIVYVDLTSIPSVIQNYSPTINLNQDIVFINMAAPANQSFSAPFPTGQNYAIRLPTSSLTQADVGQTYAIGFGEVVPGTIAFPQLNYVPINPMSYRKCFPKLASSTDANIQSVTYNNTFCVQGFVNTTITRDVCTLDVGGVIIRTSNILNPVADYEAVGIVEFGSCTGQVPALASYVWKAVLSVPAQVDKPAAGNPANPRAFDGNFACGDGELDAGQLEKCDVLASNADDMPCCNEWTCQYVKGGIPCGDKGSVCKQGSKCNGRGKCVTPNRPNRRGNCNKNVTYPTRCVKGKCCGTGDQGCTA